MRHRVAKKKLNRTSSHRKALLRNLSTALLEHGKVETTLAKAKFVKPYVEKLVTKAKQDASFTGVQRVKAKIYSDSVVRKLFEEIAPSYEKRDGGYTRIVKLGFRDGDKAPMARIELVADKKSTKSKANKDIAAEVKETSSADSKAEKPTASSTKKSSSKTVKTTKKTVAKKTDKEANDEQK